MPPRSPDRLADRPTSQWEYSGRDFLRSFLPERWQARYAAKHVAAIYHAAGFPASGVAIRLPSGSWWGLDAVRVTTLCAYPPVCSPTPDASPVESLVIVQQRDGATKILRAKNESRSDRASAVQALAKRLIRHGLHEWIGDPKDLAARSTMPHHAEFLYRAAACLERAYGCICAVDRKFEPGRLSRAK